MLKLTKPPQWVKRISDEMSVRKVRVQMHTYARFAPLLFLHPRNQYAQI